MSTMEKDIRLVLQNIGTDDNNDTSARFAHDADSDFGIDVIITKEDAKQLAPHLYETFLINIGIELDPIQHGPSLTLSATSRPGDSAYRPGAAMDVLVSKPSPKKGRR